MHQHLSGVHPVFSTPFNDDDSVDTATLDREIQWLFDNGVHGVVMAMVSETLRLSTDERRDLASAACNSASGRGAVVIGVGAESTPVAVGLARHAESIGATAVMATPPTTTAALETEVTDYYRALLDAIEIPVIIQDASGYVGQPLSLALQASLLAEYGDRVLFKPEAVPIGPRLSALRDETHGRARVFEGTGGIALVDSFRRGIVGTMPGADLCWAIVALWEALQNDDTERVDTINGPLTALISMLNSLDAFIAVEKHLLVKQGVFSSARVRGPVGFRLDHETTAEVDRLFGLLDSAATR